MVESYFVSLLTTSVSGGFESASARFLKRSLSDSTREETVSWSSAVQKESGLEGRSKSMSAPL